MVLGSNSILSLGGDPYRGVDLLDIVDLLAGDLCFVVVVSLFVGYGIGSCAGIDCIGIPVDSDHIVVGLYSRIYFLIGFLSIVGGEAIGCTKSDHLICRLLPAVEGFLQ